MAHSQAADPPVNNTEDNEQEGRPILTESELEEAEARSSATVRVVYEAVRREGEDELKRSPSALAWSGLAAGLSMGFSLITDGVLRAHLPDTAWSSLISKFGYSVGFVIVILGRQQLFTENTLTPILPLLNERSAVMATKVFRLWAIVLAANVAGSLAVSWVIGNTAVFPGSVRDAFGAIGRESTGAGFGLTVRRGIFAGWILALLVWLLPFAEHARFFVIITLTWLISIGGFNHLVAGAVEMFYLAFTGLASWGEAVGG